MPCCVDCLNFKNERKTDLFRCIKGMVTDIHGNIRYFKWNIHLQNASIFALINRGRKMKSLNPKKCMEFEDMREEI